MTAIPTISSLLRRGRLGVYTVSEWRHATESQRHTMRRNHLKTHRVANRLYHRRAIASQRDQKHLQQSSTA